MIPKKIEPYFKTTFQKIDPANNLIEGILTCCNSHDFEIYVLGEIKYSIFSKASLFPKDNTIVLEARCKKCGTLISVFNSNCDGYERIAEKQNTHTKTKVVNCKKCLHGNFSIKIRYEYPELQELEALEIATKDNAFTWIWISLECQKCKTKYKNFINFETG